MRYSWDPAKREASLAKHGIDFAAVEGFAWEVALVRADTRFPYGEVRLNALAPIGDRLHALTFAIRGTRVRVISLRLASNRERERYEAEA